MLLDLYRNCESSDLEILEELYSCHDFEKVLKTKNRERKEWRSNLLFIVHLVVLIELSRKRENHMWELYSYHDVFKMFWQPQTGNKKGGGSDCYLVHLVDVNRTVPEAWITGSQNVLFSYFKNVLTNTNRERKGWRFRFLLLCASCWC